MPRNRDYHNIIKGRLKHLAQFLVSRFACEVKVFVDTAPVMEKPLAQAAGWDGRESTPTSSPDLTDRGFYLEKSIPPWISSQTKPQPTIAARVRAASMSAQLTPFRHPTSLDATRCISYLTIEHKGPIPHEFRKAIGNRIYGCDDCLAVCPWNKFAQPTTHAQLIEPRRSYRAAPGSVVHLG